MKIVSDFQLCHPHFQNVIIACGYLKSLINIGIKHGFSCINIRQVPWEVLKTEAEGPGTTHLVMAAIMWPRYRHIECCVAVH